MIDGVVCLNKKIIDIMKKAGFELYYVGGYVRDKYLKLNGGDIDLATNAKPEELLRIAEENGIKAKQVGRTFPVVLFHLEGVDYEIATYRKDGDYSNHRHPDTFEFAETIYEDLARRDFTINAMAIDVYTGNLVDPFGGLGDMASGIIRTVGNPKERFDEDYLRILRFFRFIAKLGFEPDEATLNEILRDPTRVSEIVPERIYDEIIKIFKTKEPSLAFKLMQKTGVLNEILPEISQLSIVGQYHSKHIDDTLTHTLNVLDYVTHLGGDVLTQFAALFHDIGKIEAIEKSGDKIIYAIHAQKGAEMALGIMNRLKFSNINKKEVEYLVHHHMAMHEFDDKPDNKLTKYLRKVVAKQGEAQAYRLLLLSIADRLDCFIGEVDLNRIQILDAVVAKLRRKPTKLEINGHDIMKILDVKGKKVGEIKDILENLIIEEKIPNDEEYLKFLLTRTVHVVEELVKIKKR
jgi:putative nucleotidyltransferase with HDIG domain